MQILKHFVELDVPRVPTESLSQLHTYITEDIYFLQELANLNSIIDRVRILFYLSKYKYLYIY